MKKEFSPEERLLRLIKKPVKQPVMSATAASGAVEGGPVAPAIPPASDRPTVTSGMHGASSVSAAAKRSGIHTTNVILSAIFVCMLVFFVASLFLGDESEPDTLIEQIVSQEVEVVGEGVPAPKEVGFYTSAVKGRNIFVSPAIDSAPVITGPSLDEVSGGLSLLGIIAGDRPQAIIEDTVTGKSSFVYKGGRVGKSKIIDIGEDVVTMEYQGQTFELYL